MSLEDNAPRSGVESLESIVAAAVRYQDKIFTGKMHSEAYEKLLGEIPDAENHDPEVHDGYVTSSGRFVSQNEATKIAQKSGQFPKQPDPDLYFDSTFIKKK